MPTLDDIAPDQRAVLQMVLQRGRGYDDIAALLAIDRAAVRQRALDAFDALVASGAVPALQRALITDYLLSQLPARIADEVQARLATSPDDRDWALAAAAAVRPIATRGLPAIPAHDTPTETFGYEPPPMTPETSYDVPTPSAEAIAESSDGQPHQSLPGPVEPLPDGRNGRVSRRGGALLLALPAIVLIVAVVVVGLTLGGSKKTRPAGTPAPPTHTSSTPVVASTPSVSPTSSSASTATSGPTTPTTAGTTTAGPQLLAALNLTSPTGAKGTTGLVQVIREQGLTGIVLVAQGMPANAAHNAYAVWLRNSRTGASKIVGYVQTKVGSTGKLETEGQLPASAASYDQVLVTIETQPSPTAPGEIILSGPFRERN